MNKKNNLLVRNTLLLINAPLNGITVRRNKDTGMLYPIRNEGEKMNSYDELMMKVLTDSKTFTHLQAIPNFIVNGYEIDGGALASCSAELNEKGTLVAHIYQIINPDVLKAMDGYKDQSHSVYPIGTSIFHEISENHIAGGYYLEQYNKYSAEFNNAPVEQRESILKKQINELWNYSHPKALPQPNFKIEKIEDKMEIKSFKKEGLNFDSKTTYFKWW